MNKILQSRLLHIVILMAISLIGLNMGADKVNAVVTLSPDPGLMPGPVRTYLQDADIQPNSPTITNWVTPASNWASTSTTVPFGTATINMTFHTAMTVGWQPSSTTSTATYVTNATAGVGGLVGNYNEPIIGIFANTVGATDKRERGFTYSPAGGFTVSGTYYIQVDFQVINVFTGNPINRCVPGAAAVPSWNSFSLCPVNSAVYDIYVNVLPAPVPGCTNPGAINYNPAATDDDGSCIFNSPPSGNFSITCDPNTFVLTVTANTFDAQNPNVTVTATVSNAPPPSFPSRTQGGSGSFSMGTFQGAPSYIHYVTGTVTDTGGLSATMTQADVTCPRAFTWITGAVRNAYDPDFEYAGETIQTCNGPNATTDVNGNFAFRVREGEAFCVRVISNVAGAGAINTRPRAIGYRGCGPFGLPSIGVPNGSPNYCSATSTYEFQVATDNPANGYDRSTNDYYDIAFRFPPQVACQVSSPTIFEAGAYIPSFNIDNTGNSLRPPLTASILISIRNSTGVLIDSKLVTKNSQVINPGGNSNPDVNLITGPGFGTEAWNIPSPGTYTLNGVGGASGDGLSSPLFTCTNTNVVAANLSYLKSYGGDVWAGASFQTPCTAPNGSIETFGRTVGSNYSGSSAQFGVTALLGINQFYSASNRTPPSASVNTYPPKGATFSNSGGGTPSGTYGGGYGINNPRCLPDYYNDTRGTNVVSDNSISNGDFAGGGAIQLDMGTGDFTLSPGNLTIPNGAHVTVYASGNVYISNDIRFTNGARSTLADIPNFTLIVRGNIFVDNDVTRLDGLYIAQPAAGQQASQGRLYTCARQLTAPRLYTANDLYTACNRQLVFNGGVIAQQVRLLRTFGTLDDSTVGEAPSNFELGTGTNAAEVFNYTPEMFLAPSSLERDVQTGSYDSIVTLPPIY